MKTELGPEYLHAEDLLKGGKWSEYALTIKEVIKPGTVKAADGKIIDKAIVVFAETPKRLVLGKINERLTKCAMGSAKPQEWIDKKITIYPVKGNWFGQQDVAAIRIRIPEGRAKPFLKGKDIGTDITGVTV